MLCILCWSTTDLFYKKGSELTDKLSNLKIMVWLGIIMAIAAVLLLPLSEMQMSLIGLIIYYREYIPMAVLYVAALMCGTVGARYLDVSVASPLENVDGAVAAVILLVYFAATGRLDEGERITPWNVSSIFFVTAGVFSLPLRTAPIAMVRKMMQIRPKNTVPIPIRVTKSGLYSISSFYLSIWIIAKRLLNLQARMHILRVFNGFSLLPCTAGGKRDFPYCTESTSANA